MPIFLSNKHAWTRSDHLKLKHLASQKLKSISGEFKKFRKFDVVQFHKFEAFANLFDFSEQTPLRDFLKETSDSNDGEFASTALRCLDTLIRWDAKRVRATSIAYDEEFEAMQNLIGGKLHDETMSVKTAAFKAYSTLLALAGLLDCARLIEPGLVRNFFQTFHGLDDKIECFERLVRPIEAHSVEMRHAAHALWYVQDAQLKTMSEIDQVDQVDRVDQVDQVGEIGEAGQNNL
jgi:hypothetical protein